MNGLCIVTVSGAIVFGFHGAVNAAQTISSPLRFDLCHFSVPAANDNLPRSVPSNDHLIGTAPSHSEAACNKRGGKVLTVACPSLRRYFPNSGDFIDLICDFVP